MKNKIPLALAFLPFLAGCAATGESTSLSGLAANPDAIHAAYVCGSFGAVDAYYLNERLSLEIDGQNYDLVQTRAASGARFETPDGAQPHVLFWNKGREATLEMDGVTRPRCHQRAERSGVPDDDSLKPLAP